MFKKARELIVDFGRLIDLFRTQGLRLTYLAGRDKLRRLLQLPPLFAGITEHVLVGGQPAGRILTWLRNNKVSGVVNLRSEYNYAQKFTTDDMRYLHLPTPDNEPPSIEHLRQGIVFINTEIARGGKVYIHCWEGLGRSPTLVAAYLVSLGFTPDQAWGQIRKIRPFIRPTQTQIDRLLEFASQTPLPPPDDIDL